MDISGIPQNMKVYGGASCRKVGLTIDGVDYLMKLPGALKAKNMKNVELSYSNSPICEYMGSHIYEMLDMPVHETLLAMRDSKLVVLCKDFVSKDCDLYEFSKIKISYEPAFINQNGEETDGMGSSLPEALLVLAQHPLFLRIPEASIHFWKMFIVDAIIGNPDRNNGNWGVLVNRSTKEVTLAPVYDNGNCLNDKWDENKMLKFLDNDQLFISEAYKGKVCYFTDDSGKKINPYQLIASHRYVGCTEALNDILSILDKEAIFRFIAEQNILSDIQKRYYTKILDTRIEYLKQIKKETEVVIRQVNAF